MLIGDLIARFEDEAVALETLLGLGDLALLARAEQAAAAAGRSLGGFAASAVDRFAAEASDEDWVGLMGAMGHAEDPGRACLARMIGFALREDRHVCRHGA